MTAQDITASEDLRFERLLDAPRSKVWEYLTDPELRARWFMGGPTDLRTGGSIGLSMNHHLLSDGQVPTPERFQPYLGTSWIERIVRVDPPRLLTFTWENGQSGEVTFELFEENDKTRLILTHSGLRGREEAMDVGAGWHAHLAVLSRRLRNEPVANFWDLQEQAEVAMKDATAGAN